MTGIDGTYLGDGVYATDDGWMIALTVERGDRREVVYLDPTVLAALNVYARDRGLA